MRALSPSVPLLRPLFIPSAVPRVLARWMGGPNEHPAIIREIVITDTAGMKKKDKKDKKDEVLYTLR